MFRKLAIPYVALVEIGNSLQDLLLLLMRLLWGYLFFKSGIGKLEDIPGTAAYFESLGIPFSLEGAYLVAWVEAVGGACLFFGFATRLAAIPLILNMVVALFTAHRDALLGVIRDTQHLLNQSPSTYLLVVLVLFAFGPGRFSLDHLVEKLFKA